MNEKTPLLPGGGERRGRSRLGIVVVLAVVAAWSLLANLLFNCTQDIDANDEVLLQSEGWGWGSVSSLHTPDI